MTSCLLSAESPDTGRASRPGSPCAFPLFVSVGAKSGFQARMTGRPHCSCSQAVSGWPASIASTGLASYCSGWPDAGRQFDVSTTVMSLATSLMRGFNAVSCWKRTETMRTSTPAATSAAVTAVAPVSAAKPLRDSGPREFATRTPCPDARSLRTSVPPIIPAPTIPIFIDIPSLRGSRVRRPNKRPVDGTFMWPRRLGAAAEGRGCHKDGRGRGPPPAVFANASVLRCDLPREGLGDDLPILHHEGIRPDLVAVVRRLGLPQDVGGVPVDVLPQHLERRSGLGELLELRGEQLPNGLGPTQHPVRSEQPRLG